MTPRVDKIMERGTLEAGELYKRRGLVSSAGCSKDGTRLTFN